MPNEVLYDADHGIGRLTLNRPEALNALNRAVYDGLEAAFDQIEADDTLRVVIVSGSGDRAFAAGADISEFAHFATRDDITEYEARVERVLGRLEALPVPTIAQLRGYATGGGATVAIACDLRIASTSLQIGIPVARTLGNCLPMGNLARVLDLLGPARVKEMIFTARLYSADEALAMGLVNAVVPDDQLAERVRTVAEQIASHAPLTLKATKEGVRRLLMGRRAVSGHDLLLQCYTSADFHEGVAAFLAKRKPIWKGR